MKNSEPTYPSKSNYNAVKEQSALISGLLGLLSAVDAVEAYENIQGHERGSVDAWRKCDNAFNAWKKDEAAFAENSSILRAFNNLATRIALSIEIENAAEFKAFNLNDVSGTSKELQRLFFEKNEQHLVAVCKTTRAKYEEARKGAVATKQAFVDASQKLTGQLALLHAATAAGAAVLKINGVVIPKKKVTPRAPAEDTKPAATTTAKAGDTNVVPPVASPVTNAASNGASAPK
jgi:hypothetical protein